MGGLAITIFGILTYAGARHVLYPMWVFKRECRRIEREAAKTE